MKQVIGSFEDYTPRQQEVVRTLLNSTNPYNIVKGMLGLSDAQRRIINDILDRGYTGDEAYGYIANCSRGIGKTYLATSCWSMLVLLIARIYYERKPEHKHFWHGLPRMTRPVFRIISNTKEEMNANIQDVCSLALAMFPPEIVPRDSWHVSGSYFQLTYGARIVFKGVERNENVGRGATGVGACLDEMGTIDNCKKIIESVLNAAISRSKRAVHPDHQKIIGRWIATTTPPDTIESEFTDIYLDLEEKGRVSNFTIFDAYPTISIKEIIGYYNTSSYSTFLREYMCKMVPDLDRAIVPEFSKEEHVGAFLPFEKKHLMHHYMSIDLGATDKTVVTFGYVNPVLKKLIVEDELVFQDRQLTPNTIGTSIQKKLKTLNYPQLYKQRCDTNEPIMINGLNEDFDLNFVGIKKAELKTMVGQLRDMFKYEQILIHPRCEETISCLINGMWDKKKKAFSKNIRLGHYDALASLIYLARDVDLDINPLPSYIPDNVFSLDKVIHGDSGIKEIEKLFRPVYDESNFGENNAWMT
jgi:hypothetical protein